MEICSVKGRKYYGKLNNAHLITDPKHISLKIRLVNDISMNIFINYVVCTNFDFVRQKFCLLMDFTYILVSDKGIFNVKLFHQIVILLITSHVTF